uniref:Major facilitator superfamily (MFS) profile domain-containing protein n=1 Tax=Onchocerca volvulus TaxID=6282 RepID=A0A8R1TYD6_ONCVO
MQNISLMIGAIVAGNLADIYGRKKVLFIGTVGLMLLLLATSSALSFIVFTFLRFLDVLFVDGKHCVSNSYFMENLPDTHSPNYIILSGIAYLCRDGKSCLAAGLTVLPLIMIPYLKDTSQWLTKKGRSKEASEAAIYIKKWDEMISSEKAKYIIYVSEKSVKESWRNPTKLVGTITSIRYRKLGSYTVVFATNTRGKKLLDHMPDEVLEKELTTHKSTVVVAADSLSFKNIHNIKLDISY